MPDALKTDATKVRGCSASVWVYPTANDGRLHFLADSNAAITKGIVALVLSAVQDKPAAEVAELDVARGARAVRASKAPQRQPHAGRAQHDRAREADRRALRSRRLRRWKTAMGCASIGTAACGCLEDRNDGKRFNPIQRD